MGNRAGWLALQAGMAACADAVLIPEIPYDLRRVAAKLRDNVKTGRMHGLVVVAEGAMPAMPAPELVTAGAVRRTHGDGRSIDSLRASLAPLATGAEGPEVIERSGHAARSVAFGLQRLTDQEAYPLVLGQLLRGGAPTAVDRQLGLGYGAGAVRALSENQTGTMVAFRPPDLAFVPLADAINKVRTVPAGSLFAQLARALGISLGD
jgi:6-phosphofructokinase 1